MRKVFILLLLLSLNDHILVGSDNLLSMIENFVNYYGKTTIVSAFLCNRKVSEVLLKTLSKDRQVNILPMSNKSIFYPIPSNQILYLMDLDCNNTSHLLILAEQSKLFTAPFKWLTYSKNMFNIDNITKTFFEKINILIDSDVTVSVKQGEQAFVFWKIFKRHKNFEIITEELGNWTKGIGIEILRHFEVITSRRRNHLNGVILNTSIVITQNNSLRHLTDKRDIHIDSIAKVNYVLVEHLSNIVNATLWYSVQSTWGYKDNNSKWSGMIGELARGEADIGGTALFLTSDRIDIIDYIAMTTPTRSKFIFREPKLSYVTNVFTLPFDTYVWASTGALLLIVAIFLYIAIKWEWFKKKFSADIIETTEIEIHDSWIEIGFITFGAFCQQGTTAVPFSVPGRIIIIFLFLSFMFLYTSYSANIVALLQSSSTSIQTLDDILKSRLEVGVHDTVFNQFYFPNATEPTRRALYLQKVAPPGQRPKFYSIEEGIGRMRQGLFAFHAETGPAYKIVSETFQEGEKCGIQEIQYLQVVDPWLAIQKNSSYKKMLKVGLRLLQENGIQAREVGLIYTKKPQCLSRGSTFINVGLVDCYPALVVLVGGTAAAVIVLLLEIYVHARLKFYRKIIKKRGLRKKVLN